MVKKSWLVVVLAVTMFIVSACGGASTSSSDNASGGSNTGEGGGSEVKQEFDFPTKPITALVPNSAGGGNDAAARTLAKLMADLGLVSQPITIQNKPGGGQAVGMAEFATKMTDPHSLYVASPPTIINHLRKEGNSPFGFRDVTPLGLMYSDLAILAVKADSKYQDLRSFIEDLKANPTEISIVGGSGPGSQDHLTVMLLADKSGIDPKSVKYLGYDGSGDALTSLLGDNGQALSTDLSGITEYVKSGDVRILAVASPERLGGELADVPTYQEQGVDLVYYNWRGVFGPKNLDPEIAAYWDSKLKELTDSQEFKDEIAKSGFAPGYMNASEFTNYLEEQENMFKDILGKLEMLK